MNVNYKVIIWQYFKGQIGNDYGVAGLMGNLEAESGLYPDRLEGDIPYSSKSAEYTTKVNNGTITKDEFVNDGKGYGLAQWTYPARKKALYEMYKSGNYSSIGDIYLACTYLYYELQTSYSGVLTVLKNATSIKEASDKVLHDFENPADQSEAVELKRNAMGIAIYEEITGESYDGPDDTDDPDEPDEPDIPTTNKKKRKYKFILFNRKRYLQI